MDRHVSASNQDSLSIFLAGAPGTSSARSLLEYFRQFGDVRAVEPKPCRGEEALLSSGNKKPKHFWILRTGDRQTYEKILAARPCYFAGRKLHLTPFRTGIQLILHNHRTSKKRVLIKRVPIWVDQRGLIDSIERQYGVVQTYFRFEPDPSKQLHSNLSSQVRNSYTYSVTFCNKIDRDSILEAGRLTISPEVSVPVEKFMHTAELRKTQMQNKRSTWNKTSSSLILESPLQGSGSTITQLRPVLRDPLKAIKMDYRVVERANTWSVIQSPNLGRQRSPYQRSNFYPPSFTGRNRLTSAEDQLQGPPCELDVYPLWYKPSQRRYHEVGSHLGLRSNQSESAELGHSEKLAAPGFELPHPDSNLSLRYNLHAYQLFSK